MSTFVLVHGACQSNGTWNLLAPLLEVEGRRLITPVLTGLGIEGELSKSPELAMLPYIAF